MNAQGQIVRGLINPTIPGESARSLALAVRQDAWERSLPRSGGMFGNLFGGGFIGKTISHAAHSIQVVAKGSAGVTRAVTSGGSIKTAFDKYVAQPTGQGLKFGNLFGGGFIGKTISHAAHSIQVVAKGSAGVTRAVTSGGSIKTALDKYVSQPTGQGLKSPGVLTAIGFIPVVGTYVKVAATLALAVAAAKRRRAEERMSAIQSAQLDAQIADIEKKIATIKAKSKNAHKAKSKNAQVARQAADNAVASKPKPVSLGHFLIGAAIAAKVLTLM